MNFFLISGRDGHIGLQAGTRQNEGASQAGWVEHDDKYVFISGKLIF